MAYSVERQPEAGLTIGSSSWRPGTRTQIWDTNERKTTYRYCISGPQEGSLTRLDYAVCGARKIKKNSC